MAKISREVWIDWLRVIACFMVFVVHSTEPFYLGGQGSLILTESDAFWSSFFDSLVRSCVPLFVIASSYLQFPVKYSTCEFFKRRAVRILIPFAIWTAVYAFVWGEPADNFRNLLLNFNYSAGHLWFVYMLIGVYLLMPLLSKWAETVGRKEGTPDLSRHLPVHDIDSDSSRLGVRTRGYSCLWAFRSSSSGSLPIVG